MVNCFGVLKSIIRVAMKMIAGITPQKVEIEPGTTINFWAPTENIVGKSSSSSSRRRRPSVVLLHGFFLDGIFTWVFQVLALVWKYDIYIPDLLFFGDSTTDRSERSVNFQAECVARGLSKLGVEKCTVVGFSYGGFVGFKMAKMYPKLVNSVIATGTPMKLDECHKSITKKLLPESMDKLKLLISIGSNSKLFTSFPNFFYMDLFESMYFYRKERAELLEAMIDDEFYFYPAAKYSQKLHLLWGEKDRIITLETAFHIKGEVGDEVKLEYIAETGHMANIESPRIYNQHLNRILMVE